MRWSRLGAATYKGYIISLTEKQIRGRSLPVGTAAVAHG